MNLTPKDLITDHRGRLGIVLEKAKSPDAEWLKIQSDGSMQKVPVGTVWWNVLPLDGGVVLVPESLAKFEREATTEDIMEAYNKINAANPLTFRQFLAKFEDHKSILRCSTPNHPSLDKQILAVLSGVLIFIILGPAAGSNIFGLFSLYMMSYFLGAIPAAVAGLIYSLVTLWLFKSNKLESVGMWLRVGAFRGSLIGLVTAFIFVFITGYDSRYSLEDTVGFSFFMGFCGILGGAASGHLAEKAMRKIYLSVSNKDK